MKSESMVTGESFNSKPSDSGKVVKRFGDRSNKMVQ
jgi:hypothetical protein